MSFTFFNFSVIGVELTVTPKTDISKINAQDLGFIFKFVNRILSNNFIIQVSSMIGSIASSMDLAKSVITDNGVANNSDNAGVEQFAALIDQVISRFSINLAASKYTSA